MDATERRSYSVRSPRRWAGRIVLALVLMASGAFAQAQDGGAEPVKPVPVLSGGAGFIPFFNGGHVTYVNIFSPVLLVPIGDKWLLESRAAFEMDATRPDGGGPLGGVLSKELEYFQLDYLANRYLTITAGRFLTPFGIYNERLYPVWIRNLQQDPLILPVEQGSSDGVMARGGFSVSPKVNLNYAAYVSTLSQINKLESGRLAGGRVGIFLPKPRLELGVSYQHLLQDDRSDRVGFHGEWQPPVLPLDIRSEYVHSSVGQGYWIEPAYKLSQVPIWNKVMRRTQFVGRMQQFWANSLSAAAGLPDVNTRQGEFGLNYYLKDGLKATSSYGRQFSADGNRNIWTVGVAWRFAFPLGHGGLQ